MEQDDTLLSHNNIEYNDHGNNYDKINSTNNKTITRALTINLNKNKNKKETTT